MSGEERAEGDAFASGRPQGRAPGQQIGVDLNGRFYVNSADSVGANRFTSPSVAPDGSMHMNLAALDQRIVGKVALREYVQEQHGITKQAANETIADTLRPLGKPFVDATRYWDIAQVQAALAQRDGEISAMRAEFGARGGRAKKKAAPGEP